MTEQLLALESAQTILTAVVGSARYGYASEDSDADRFLLTRDTDIACHDPEANTTYFAWSVQHAMDRWGHPMLMGNLTGECTGSGILCGFLRRHRRDLAYAAPGRSAMFGLAYIGGKELSGYGSGLKSNLLTAFLLSHMAAEAEDPFLLSGEEREILTRARSAGVPAAERVDIYRRTISPENINRLMRMPDHPTIKNELFQLIEEVITC